MEQLAERARDESAALLVLDPAPVGDSVASLERLAILARAGLPVIASATSTLATGSPSGPDQDPDDWGCAPEPVEQAFAQLRSSPLPRRIAVVWPGPLRRQPYGRQSSPVDGLDFEEFEPNGGLEQLPWLGGGVLAVLAFGQAWAEAGARPASPKAATRTESWPVFVTPSELGGDAAPVARAEFSERGVDKLASRGSRCCGAFGVRDAIELGSLRSIAADGAAFDGPFGSV